MNLYQLSRTYQTDFLKRVSPLLEIASVYEDSNTYPYGKPIDDALNVMLSMGKADGFTVKNVDGQAGHIEFGSGEGLVGILGHLDVVPAGDGWTTPAFTPTVRDGKLYARGAQDDKGPVMAAYMAMKILKDQGFQPKKRVRLIVGTDEERDWQGIEYYFKHEEMPGFGFSPDASFPVIHAEKGLLDGYLSFPLEERNRSEHTDLIEVRGGNRLNMVPDQAKAVIRSSGDIIEHFNHYLKENNLLGTIHQEDDYFTILMEGSSAHASKPEEGVNALTTLLTYLNYLPMRREHIKLINEVNHAFSNPSGKGVGINQTDNVSGPLTVNLGSLIFQIDDQCRVGINVRYPVTVSYDSIVEKLTHFAEERGGQFEIYDHLQPLYVEEDHPFIQTLLKVYNTVTREDESVQSMGGATYARSLQTGVAYGAMFKNSSDTAHQKDEHVCLEDITKAIHIYAAAIYELTK